MIKTFADKATAAVFANERVRGFPPGVFQAARRKLEVLDKAGQIEDLRAPPGNRLEKLSGNYFQNASGLFGMAWRGIVQNRLVE